MMNYYRKPGFLLFLLLTFLWVRAGDGFVGFAEIGSISIHVFGAMTAAISNLFPCTNGECCESAIKFNFTGLQTALTDTLYGQHLVKGTVLRLLKRHLSSSNQRQPLVLSFHGWIGSGKNFVSRLIASHTYVYGQKSRFVHLFVATLHIPHKHKVAEYQDNLRSWIHGNVSICERSMFIFDEMDRMPNGMLDAINPYLDTYHEIDGVNYRKSIFIFLSNTGSYRINQWTLEYKEANRRREDITHKEMEELISLSSFNEEGGLWHSSLIENHMISAFVAFLPLEREHVKHCVKADMKAKGHYPIRDDLVNQVLDELTFLPNDKQIFSTSGCKRVAQKVDLIIDQDDLDDVGVY